MAGLLPSKQRLELNRLVWTTESRDLASTAQYGNAENSAFELGVDEVTRYGWPGVPGPCYGRVQHFFFVRATDGGRAVLMASVNLFASLGPDPLTGLPLVDSSAVSSRNILARHLNHRVIMPVVGTTLSQTSRLSQLKAAVSRAAKKMGGVHQPSAIMRHMSEGDDSRRELVAFEAELRLATSVHRLVLGARCNDVEGVVPP